MMIEKNIFLECPEKVPGMQFGEPVQAELERTVVGSAFFGEALPPGRILAQHKCWFRPVFTPVKAHLTLARVAGYRHAEFGLPEKSHPILFQHPEHPHIMISTIPLSSFAERRFAPFADWKLVMEKINEWLGVKEKISSPPPVRPAFGATEKMPEETEARVFTNSARWFNRHVFFEYADKIGVFEGYVSGIESDGHQFPRAVSRGDCTGEAAMIPALDWAINKNYAGRKNAGRILSGLFRGGKLADTSPTSPTYGGVFFYENLPVFYSDDNCRAALSGILSSELTGNRQFTPDLLRCLWSIFLTTGRQGFRYGRLDNPKSFENGKTCRDYQNEDYIEYRPHYQASMWAGFLQAYVLTGYEGFLAKAKHAIGLTMEVFPRLNWTNGITQEYARLLLPLAFLVEVEDTPAHRAWLRKAAGKLLENMVECGTIREMMGDLEYGKYPAPRSNEEYGTTEAPLIQRNGDPVCDLLYTVNYAFPGLHEAAIATGEKLYIEAENRLADFLSRIQIKSETRPYLNGCWMRGFDYNLWEYCGSSADNGWGAWSVESGWTNSWIAATFGLRRLKRGFLCRKNADCYRRIFSEVSAEPRGVQPLRSFRAAAAVTPGAE